jgi:hypothetical protein
MEKIVPLPSAFVKGRLGVARLPRLWLAEILAAAGMLPDGYSTTDDGLNRLVLDGIGIDPVAMTAFLRTRPQYAVFEQWVGANAQRLNQKSIEATNAAVDAEQLQAARAAEACTRFGLTEAQRTASAAVLEALDDWDRVHRDVTARRGTRIQPIVPAVSMQGRGPLGLMHLPRLWIKATLNACDALYDGWRSGSGSGFDVWFTGAVGLELDATIAYIHAELPTYPVFERWVVARAERVSPTEVVEHNAVIWRREKPEAVAAPERALLGIDAPGYRPSIELNDLVDWYTLHEVIARIEADAADRLTSGRP